MQYCNTPPPYINLSSAQILFHCQLRDHIPTNPVHYKLHKDWIISANQCEKALAQRNENIVKKYNVSTRQLPEVPHQYNCSHPRANLKRVPMLGQDRDCSRNPSASPVPYPSGWIKQDHIKKQAFYQTHHPKSYERRADLHLTSRKSRKSQSAISIRNAISSPRTPHSHSRA